MNNLGFKTLLSIFNKVSSALYRLYLTVPDQNFPIEMSAQFWYLNLFLLVF